MLPNIAQVSWLGGWICISLGTADILVENPAAPSNFAVALLIALVAGSANQLTKKNGKYVIRIVIGEMICSGLAGFLTFELGIIQEWTIHQILPLCVFTGFIGAKLIPLVADTIIPYVGRKVTDILEAIKK